MENSNYVALTKLRDLNKRLMDPIRGGYENLSESLGGYRDSIVETWDSMDDVRRKDIKEGTLIFTAGPVVNEIVRNLCNAPRNNWIHLYTHIKDYLDVSMPQNFHPYFANALHIAYAMAAIGMTYALFRENEPLPPKPPQRKMNDYF
jgi:hypothetical protein